MEGSEWEDDAEYPPAPVPAHERAWRHPSEVGNDAWHHSEPPLVIGRGLSAATGAIGVLLGLAVLWTMLPTHGTRSAGVAVRSTESTLIADTPLPTVTTPSTTATLVSTSLSASTTQLIASTVAPTTSVRPPMPTYQVGQQTTALQGAVAVAVGDGQLVLTTANAVAQDHTVQLVTSDGELKRAQVLVVDVDAGLAVLAPDTFTDSTGFAQTSDVEPGDQLTFTGEQTVVYTVGDEGLDTGPWQQDQTIREGSPVVNQNGELVALCTRSDEGVDLVPVGELDDVRRALGAAIDPPVRMGVVLNDDPSGALTVGALEPDGPAALAGLDVGDTIVAVDGEPVDDLDELAGMLALHEPGDIISVELRSSDGTDLMVDLVLAPAKPTL